VFRWDALAQTVVQRTPLSQQEWTRSRACIVDGQGRVLADSAGRILQEVIDFPARDELLRQPLAARVVEFQGRPHCVAHAASPGYETYRSGWHSLILQALQAAAAGAKNKPRQGRGSSFAALAVRLTCRPPRGPSPCTCWSSPTRCRTRPPA